MELVAAAPATLAESDGGHFAPKKIKIGGGKNMVAKTAIQYYIIRGSFGHRQKIKYFLTEENWRLYIVMTIIDTNFPHLKNI